MTAKGFKYAKLSEAQMIAKQNAWAKAMESKKYEDNAPDVPGIRDRKAVKDGYSTLKKLKLLTNCELCPARSCCPEYDKIQNADSDKAKMDCPLWHTYRSAIIDVTQNPLMYLSKKAAELDMAIAQQKMIDNAKGIPLSKLMLSATKVALEAVKISKQANKSSDKLGRKVYGSVETDLIINM